MRHFEEEEDDPTSISSPSFKFRYDVFLSFRGEDTRHTITARLYKKLLENGIRTFFDEDGLERGEEINPCLLTAIEDSATSIAVISKNYAESRWCLEELSKILDCKRRLFPVFYEVDPSHVRHHKESFEKHFRTHEERYGKDSDKVIRWKKAMEKAGGTAGWDSRNWEESQMIQNLIKKILTKLRNTPLSVAMHPIGIESRVQEVIRMLDLNSNDVRFMGFHGMGGIGKTTLAKAVYNSIFSKFEHRSFIPDVRETSTKENGLVSLQNKLLNNLFLDKTLSVDEVDRGIIMIKQRIHEKRVLVVLDDVDDASQLNALAGSKDWFHEGSRIIITTRDTDILKQLCHNNTYEVKVLNDSESLQLFSYYAFSREKPTEDFEKLSKEVVSRSGQLPLALEVLGTYFFHKRRIKKDWEDGLETLKDISPGDLQGVLMISFNGLDEQEKCIFLDIACFFIGMERENAMDILKGCGFHAETVIEALVKRSLIKIYHNDTLWMHDQLRDMGRNIARGKNFQDAGTWSRLWDSKKIMSVLKSKKGTRSIQGIALNIVNNKKRSSSGSQIQEVLKLHTESFAPMSQLRLLQISNVMLEGKFNLIPSELKWFQWKKCPLEALPSDFCPSELAVLDLSESRIKQVWDQPWWRCWQTYKVAENLMVLNLFGCYNLTATPDFSRHPCLKKLILERCTSLIEIHESIGDLTALCTLNLKDCSNLIKFPNDISGLKNLESFILSGCSKLEALPEDLSSLKSLVDLFADGTAIRRLPDSISRLKRLQRLSLNGCKSLKRLPNTIGQLRSLMELSLGDSSVEDIPDSIKCLVDLERLRLMMCESLTTVPASIGELKSLVELALSGSSILGLPDTISLLSNLKYLSLDSCRNLKELPASIGGLVSLTNLHLDRTSFTELPDEIGNLTMLAKLEMRDCESLSHLPDSIGNLSSLTTLLLVNAKITKLPDSIGQLKKLEILNINKCKELTTLPDTFGELNSLRELQMEKTGVAELPQKFGMLSSLMVLKMSKRPSPQFTGEHAEIIVHTEEVVASSVAFPDGFSNLSLLYQLDASYCKLSGVIPDDFGKLSSLEELKLSHNNICRLPSSLKGLTLLKELLLSHCTMLTSLPPLPSSLILLDITNCTALASISDLSNLENLQELRLTNCKNVTDIPGLECLNLLKRLYMGGCGACFSTMKKQLSKANLKRIRNLCVPGSEIPDWLVKEVPRFSCPKHREIVGLVICVVVSLEQQKKDDLRGELPAIVDIQAKIIREKMPIFTTTLYLMGVPDTQEDQMYLCRYPHYHPLVSLLNHGDSILVTMRNPSVFQGLELKKYGIRPVFEGDDDIEDDDEMMNETEKSVSESLTNFISSSGRVEGS